MSLKIGSWLEKLATRIAIKKLFNKIDNMKGSWKTTAFGLLAALGTMGAQLMTVLDNDPLTNPDVPTFITAAMTALALFGLGKAARDREITSEQESAAKAERQANQHN